MEHNNKYEHDIVYIHGAFASSICFNRMRERLPDHNAHNIEYNIDQDLESIILDISAYITKIGRPVSIISHSLGGVIAVAVSNINPLVSTILTMGTPFGGSKAANIMKWFNHHIMFESICTTSSTLRRIAKTPISCPVTCIVTSKMGNPMFTELNDGVVTVASQMTLKGAHYIKLSVTHSEVLVMDESITIARNMIFVKDNVCIM